MFFNQDEGSDYVKGQQRSPEAEEGRTTQAERVQSIREGRTADSAEEVTWTLAPSARPVLDPRPVVRDVCRNAARTWTPQQPLWDRVLRNRQAPR